MTIAGMSLNWVDGVIAGLILFSGLIGFARGLVREAWSLVIWCAALLAAWLYHSHFVDLLAEWIALQSLRPAAAFALVAFVVLIVGAVIGHWITGLVQKTGLTGTDRLLGLLFGGARGGLLAALAVFLAALTPMAEESWWKDSMLIGRFQVLAERALSEVPPELVDRVKNL